MLDVTTLSDVNSESDHKLVLQDQKLEDTIPTKKPIKPEQLPKPVNIKDSKYQEWKTRKITY